MKFTSKTWTWLFLLLVLSIINHCAYGEKQKTLHRLVGGHLVSRPELDDAELIITSSAGGGREGKTQSGGGGGGEDKKTLSQQVADGKYGLIQNELFSKPVKRPGLISYEANPEVPKDNINNLGGLTKDDIWLAENHLLVIKGGSFGNANHESEGGQTIWPPIDDYKAPGRQVKLPSNPKVPPPFPVQLTENGPLQILGTNFTATLNGSFSAAPYPLPPPENGFYPIAFPPGSMYPTNITAGETPFPISPFPQDYGAPPTSSQIAAALNVSGMPPFFASLPPGAAILPPPGNITAEYDDDDPSIYYPPPYSFYYQMDNATQVPPGPLVPGIVLPPPPNFFAPLEKLTRKKPLYPHRVTTTEIMKQVKPPTTSIPPTPLKPSRIKIEEIHKITPVPPKVLIKVEETTPQPPPRVVTILPVKYPQGSSINRTETQKVRNRPESVTVLKPVKTISSTQRPIYYYNNDEGKTFKLYGPPTRPRTTISTTQVPLKVYFSTSNEIDSNSVVTQLPEIDYYTSRPTTKSPRQYYYYEEHPQVNSITTQRAPKQSKFYNVPQDYYNSPSKQTVRENYHQQQNKPQAVPQNQYYYRASRPPSSPSRFRFIEATKKPTADTFSIHVARLKQQIHQYYTTPEPYVRYEAQRPSPSPKPVYQFSFQAANYQPQHQQIQQQQPVQRNNPFRASPIDDGNDDINFRPINKYNKYSVEIQPAIEVIPTRQTIYENTQQPNYHYRHNPIHQIKQTSTERPAPAKYYTTTRPDYDYDDGEVVKRKPLTATPRPISQYSFEATQNPLYQPYYTKQEETYFDDITKKYFTIFGKKIPNPTTPLPNISTKRPNVQIQYAQSAAKEASLHGDTLVNYVRQRPIDPDAEYIHRPVNIRRPTSQQSVNAEIVEAIPVKIATSAEGKPGSFISYELPGDDGAHFYFLTPQLAQRRDQGAGFYYESPQVKNRNENINSDSDDS